MDIVDVGIGNITVAEQYSQNYTYLPRDTAIVFLIISTTLYGCRLWSRRLNGTKIGLDDILMIPAFLFQTAYNVGAILSANYGSGEHFLAIISVSQQQFTNWGIWNVYVVPYLYLFAVTLPKLSILTLYLRIFNDRISRWTCWLIAFVLIVNVIVESISLGLQCNHLEYAWEQWNQAGNCGNITEHFTLASLPNLITDLIMLLLPLPALRKLQVERRVKVGLGFTFLLGSLGLVTGLIRMATFVKYEQSLDGTWYAGILLFYSIIETNTYFVSACLLTYRPLLTRIWKTAVTSVSRTRRSAWLGSKMPGSSAQSRDRSQAGFSHTDLEGGLPVPPPGRIRMDHAIDQRVSTWDPDTAKTLSSSDVSSKLKSEESSPEHSWLNLSSEPKGKMSF